jgi:hypothetical protein
MAICPELDIAEMFSPISVMLGQTGGAALFQEILIAQEAPMAGIKSERARDRARDLLATVYPAPDDVEFRRLRELAIDFVQEAERREAEKRGRAVEPDELISTALDAVARDYFKRAVLRAVSRQR